jgi:hypothetical protein
MKLKDAKVQLAVEQEGFCQQQLSMKLEIRSCHDILKQIALKQKLTDF